MKKYKFLWILFIFIGASLACELSYVTQIPKLTPILPGLASTVEPIQPTFVQLPTVTPGSIAVGDIKQLEEILIRLYEQASPGVVAIQTLSQQGGGLGSGFVFDKLGHIITNYHVVENAQQLELAFPSGFKVRGNVIGTDLDSDLAVIKIEAPPEELHPLPLGDSDQLKVGQTVVAIGNPYGLSGTMTLGIISAKGRTLDSIRQSSEGNYYSAGDIIQTDASINPGNSGGPLLNLNGDVVGINRAIRTTGITATGDPINSGIGFAISGNIARRVIPYLIENGKYDYPYMGITARSSITLIEQEILGLSQATGAYITGVEPGGPADKAGLRGGSRNSQVAGILAG